MAVDVKTVMAAAIGKVISLTGIVRKGILLSDLLRKLILLFIVLMLPLLLISSSFSRPVNIEQVNLSYKHGVQLESRATDPAVNETPIPEKQHGPTEPLNQHEEVNEAPTFPITVMQKNETAEQKNVSDEKTVYSDKQQDVPKLTSQKSRKAGKYIPILYYHAVNDKMDGIEELYVSPAEFDKQMQYLKENNYNAIGFDELSKVSSLEKPFIITFDDGYEDNYTFAYPVLKKYNFKATIFVCADAIGKPNFLKKNQMEEMKDLISFESHTVTHSKLSLLKEDQIDLELSDSKKIIGELTGKEVSVLAYPYGDYDHRVINIAKKYYRYAVVSGGGFYYEGDDAYEIKRVYVPRELNLKGFIKKITG